MLVRAPETAYAFEDKLFQPFDKVVIEDLLYVHAITTSASVKRSLEHWSSVLSGG